jgi:hypothetical protein
MIIYMTADDKEIIIRYPHGSTLDLVQSKHWKIGPGDPLWQFNEQQYLVKPDH